MRHVSVQGRVPSWRTFTSRVLIALILGASPTAAQECVPFEIPAPPPDPGCGGIVQRVAGCPAQREWRDAVRTFVDPVSFETGAASEDEITEWTFSVIGCAGAVVAPLVEHEHLRRIAFSVTSPSGATLLNENRNVGQQSILSFPAVDLPQSGHYSVRIRTWAPRQSFETCADFDIRRLRCDETATGRGHPRSVHVTWRGSAGLHPMEIGDEWRTALEPGLPTSRRIRLDPGMSARIHIMASPGSSISAQASVALGGVVVEQLLSTGSGELLIPEVDDYQDRLVRLAVDSRGNGAVGVTVVVDSTTADTEPGHAEGSRVLYEGESIQGRIAPGASSDRWTLSGVPGSRYRLLVVPSELAGLVLSVIVFDPRTEEVLAREANIARRTEIVVGMPDRGDLVVEVHGVRLERPDTDGRALYTFRLEPREP